MDPPHPGIGKFVIRAISRLSDSTVAGSERLAMLPDGRLAYEFKRPWRDGTSRVIYSPLEFIEKFGRALRRSFEAAKKRLGMMGHVQGLPSFSREPVGYAIRGHSDR